MATTSERAGDEGEQADPEPEEFALNLTFCSVDDLIEEMKRRCGSLVLLYAYTDVSREEEPAPNNASGVWYEAAYKGGCPILIGMMETAKADLLKTWTDRE